MVDVFLGLLVAPVTLITDLLLLFPTKVWVYLRKNSVTRPYIDKLPSSSFLVESIWFRRLAGGEVERAYLSLRWSLRVVWDAPVVAYDYLLCVLVLKISGAVFKILTIASHDLKRAVRS